jgi:hypothetical protein
MDPPAIDEILAANPNLFGPNGKFTQVVQALCRRIGSPKFFMRASAERRSHPGIKIFAIDFRTSFRVLSACLYNIAQT